MTMRQARRQHRQYKKSGGKLSLKTWARAECAAADATGKLVDVIGGRR